MPTENRSSNTEMVSVPRELLQRLVKRAGSLETPYCGACGVEDKARAEGAALLAQPAEQHQTSKIADALEACEWLETPIGHKAIIRRAIQALRADTGEVERLRYKAELYDEVWELATALGYMNVTTAISRLRAQLAERAALLRSLKNRPVHEWASGKIETEIDAALSASPEPQVKS
ncbi:hypothetical protein [Pseudomonas sp. UBA5568]|uniref:hypothetical protein n=1 Tax=Pseudomonas sp. UBA5568 TaxID=1947319 RepID=UPI0025985552|nr:hypothetical protein [Pseudomonas sp. UBA5568]